MTIQELHYEIKLQYNKLDSNHNGDLVPAMIDRFINSQTLKLIESIYSGNKLKTKPYGFETTQQYIDILSNYTVKNPDQPALPYSSYDSSLNVYEFKLKDLKYNYLHLIRMFFNTNCGMLKVGKIHQEQHDDLSVILNDEMSKPSKIWKRVVAVLGKDSTDNTKSSIYVYTDGLLTLESLNVEYLKYPRKVFYGGYDTLEFLSSGVGYTSLDQPVNSDLPDIYHHLLVEMVVQSIASTLYDFNTSNLKQQNINNYA